LACERASDAQIDAVVAARSELERRYDTLDMVDIFELDMQFDIAIKIALRPALCALRSALCGEYGIDGGERREAFARQTRSVGIITCSAMPIW